MQTMSYELTPGEQKRAEHLTRVMRGQVKVPYKTSTGIVFAGPTHEMILDACAELIELKGTRHERQTPKIL
jgi:hypothetical protein